jgi:cytochrome c-type protein NapC
MVSAVSLIRNRFVKICVVLAVVGVGMVASWAALDTAFHATGDYEFCTSCHAYAPIAAAYREDPHGGNNEFGVRAACNDCHLPHDNSLHYFWVKAKHGVVDPTMELLKEPHEIDWHAIRERREEFVYDSSCLNCHKYLQEATEGNRMAARAHKRYFSGETDRMCVSCHENVGHNRLGYHLEQMGWKKEDSKAQQ